MEHGSPRTLRNLVILFLSLLVLSTAFLGYWEYRREAAQFPAEFNALLQGRGHAPEQYRVGVLQTAAAIDRVLHTTLPHGLALIDLIASAGTALVLFRCLQGMKVYVEASLAERAFAGALFIVLLQFYFGWAMWFQRPETLTTAFAMALLLWFLTPNRRNGRRGVLVPVVGTLLVTFLQAMVRADIVVTLEAGVVLLCLVKRSDGLALSRGRQLALSLLALLLAGGTQLYMMRVVYPHATYGGVPVFQLLMNLRNPAGLIPFLLFMTPSLVLIWLLRRDRSGLDEPSLALLPGAALFCGLWGTVGRVDEVRIVLPYTVALAPLLATVLMRAVLGAKMPAAATSPTSRVEHAGHS